MIDTTVDSGYLRDQILHRLNKTSVFEEVFKYRRFLFSVFKDKTKDIYPYYC